MVGFCNKNEFCDGERRSGLELPKNEPPSDWLVIESTSVMVEEAERLRNGLTADVAAVHDDRGFILFLGP